MSVEIDNIIQEALTKFNQGMETTGRNIARKLSPVAEGLAVDDNAVILSLQPILQVEVENAIMEGVDTVAFQRRIDGLKRPLAKIREAVERDFTRKLGELPDSAKQEARFIEGDYSQKIDEDFEGLDIDGGVVDPIMTIFRDGVGSTIPQVKSKLNQRVPQIIANFGQFRGDNLYDQYARDLGDMYSDAVGLIWARYEGPDDDNNRDFCHCRVNQHWRKDEIQRWGTMNWDGRIPDTSPQNVITNLGGYRCRHRLVWVETRRVPQATRDKAENGRDLNCGTI